MKWYVWFVDGNLYFYIDDLSEIQIDDLILKENMQKFKERLAWFFMAGYIFLYCLLDKINQRCLPIKSK